MKDPVDLDASPWESPSGRPTQKRHRVGDRVLRLVEYDQALVTHWCRTDPVGHIVHGAVELEFDQ